MSFYRFKEEDIIHVSIKAHPSYRVERNGDQVTGSVFLEKKFLNNSLLNRQFEGYSEKEGGLTQKTGPFTASIDIVDVEQGATNKELYESILELYDFYALVNTDYTPNFTGSETTRFRVIVIPEIYYDNSVLSGAFTASDIDSSGDTRNLFDNGRGGIYSGSLSGTLVGNIFYSEGLVVLKGGGLQDEGAGEDFGEASSTNFLWSVDFKGVHKIPTNIFKCRAPAGQLNASTNPTFFHVPDSGSFKNQKEIVLPGSGTYVTTIGLYNEDYELVGLAKLAQPIKKEEKQDILFRVRLDF